MESWLLADLETLGDFYGKGFKLPKNFSKVRLEGIPKNEVMAILEKSTSRTGKGTYSKGKHSFKILMIVRPEEVAKKSPWARYFLETLREKAEEFCG
ncbi:DUF4276 family protein [Acanthopleuribacter pedis]|uniref:DUF4276 family protein n=1 Tax=Acanthopleuribacter pedis TaxID=442870 RepID=A0A8J7U3J8_9BACT|nr:DUF4276 family protein [Acanthopleuribacter pedis]MBO1320493.1 DUF4276 family protein [Acanthopleuribacter pedis]